MGLSMFPSRGCNFFCQCSMHVVLAAILTSTARDGAKAEGSLLRCCERATGRDLQDLVSGPSLRLAGRRRVVLTCSKQYLLPFRAECEAQVSRANGALHKSFPGLDEAVQYMRSYHKDYSYSPSDQTVSAGSTSQIRPETSQSVKRGAAEEGAEAAANPHSVKKPKLRIVEKDVSNENDMYVAPQSKRLAGKMKAAEETDGRGRKKIKEIDVRQTDGDVAAHPAAKAAKKAQIDVLEVDSAEEGASNLPVKMGEDGVRVIECYTDGAASQNGKLGAQAGWGVYWPEGEDPSSDLRNLNESRRLSGPLQTNNRAELMAIIRAIELCPDPNAQLIIYTDSMYCIKGELSKRTVVQSRKTADHIFSHTNVFSHQRVAAELAPKQLVDIKERGSIKQGPHPTAGEAAPRSITSTDACPRQGPFVEQRESESRSVRFREKGKIKTTAIN